MQVFAVLCFVRETRGIIEDTLEPAKSFKGGSKESLMYDSNCNKNSRVTYIFS